MAIVFVYEEHPTNKAYPYMVTTHWDTRGLERTPKAIREAVLDSNKEMKRHENIATDWLYANFGPQRARWSITRSFNAMSLMFYFKTKADAMQFKLAMA